MLFADLIVLNDVGQKPTDEVSTVSKLVDLGRILKFF